MGNSKTKGARVAAARAETEGYTREQPIFAPLRLHREESDGTVIRIARSLRKVCPIFGAEEVKATMVAGALMGYAFERKPVSEEQWCALLAEVLNDNEAFLRLLWQRSKLAIWSWHCSTRMRIGTRPSFKKPSLVADCASSSWSMASRKKHLLLMYGQWRRSQQTKALKVNSAKGSVSCVIGRNCSHFIILFPRIHIPPI